MNAPSDRRRPGRVYFLGRRPYGLVHDAMARLQELRIAGSIDDTILLVEHERVVTLGRGAKASNVLFSEEALAARGYDRFETGRGGDVTYHGPGQLVGYPILDLKPDRCDLRKYVRRLAEVMILTARDFGVEAGTVDGMIGVWADAHHPEVWATAPWAGSIAKVGAIGVKVSRWVTMHGFALNLEVDPLDFSVIVPCGIGEHPVTSLHLLTSNPSRSRLVHDVALGLQPHLETALELELHPPIDVSAVAADHLFETLTEGTQAA